MEPIFEPDELLKVEEVAERLRVSKSTVRDWVFTRFIPFLKLGASKRAAVRFHGKALNQWLEENKMPFLNEGEVQSKKLEKSSRKTMKDFTDYIEKIRKLGVTQAVKEQREKWGYPDEVLSKESARLKTKKNSE